MKLKLDENIPTVLVDLFRGAGHDAPSSLDQKLGGAPDPQIAGVCRAEGRVLGTLDLDFGDIRAYRPSEHAGLVILRPRRQDAATLERVGVALLRALAAESPAGCTWIVDETRIRSRGE